MSIQPHRQRLAELIEAVLAGKTSASAAFAETQTWNDVPQNDWVYESAREIVTHYYFDEDIRERDSSYDKGYRQSLRRSVIRLRCPPSKGILDWLGWRTASK